MKLPAILSTAASGLCLALSVWLFFASGSNSKLQGELQTQQQELQTQQQATQLQRQQLQTQQDQINAGTKLAQEVGPAVLRDLGTAAVQNKNEKIKTLLTKYGVTVSEATPAPGAAPAPANP